MSICTCNKCPVHNKYANALVTDEQKKAYQKRINEVFGIKS